MTEATLKYLSQGVLDFLIEKVPEHLDRYISGDFDALRSVNGWAVETSTLKCDFDLLSRLEHGNTSPQIEIKNSQIVFGAIKGITPAIARDERIWARLTHVECLEYSRSRWLGHKPAPAIPSLVQKHFFGPNLTAVRDDNAIGRLWWNGQISSQAMPEAPERALLQILKTADIRQAVVERSLMFSRPSLAKAIIVAMETWPWVTESAENFRSIIKVVNRNGSGLLFEALPDGEVLDFVNRCAEIVKRVDPEIAAQ